MTTIARYTKKLVRYLRNTRAVSALEYAILVGVIAVAIAAALQTFSGKIEDAMETIQDLPAQVSQISAAPPPKQSLSFFGTGRWGGSGVVALSYAVHVLLKCFGEEIFTMWARAWAARCRHTLCRQPRLRPGAGPRSNPGGPGPQRQWA